MLSKAAEYRAGLAAMGLGDPDAPPGRSVALPDGPVTIVDVYGIQVNAVIAERVRAMVDAARASGLELAEGSGGWRSPERQIQLRRAHCGTSDYAVYQMPPSQCSPPTARPGTSEHERGLAIDFRCNGGSIGQQARSNPCVVWLRAHAAAYGLYNLPSEAWHWSTSGQVRRRVRPRAVVAAVVLAVVAVAAGWWCARPGGAADGRRRPGGERAADDGATGGARRTSSTTPSTAPGWTTRTPATVIWYHQLSTLPFEDVTRMMPRPASARDLAADQRRRPGRGGAAT